MTPTNEYTRTHKASGWTRTPIRDGSMRYSIQPTDDSGERIVRFMSAGSWQNDPTDDKTNVDRDRVVLLEGASLPDWAVRWLEAANHKSMERARASFRTAMEDDEDSFFGRNTGW